jgi:hypothetical protein
MKKLLVLTMIGISFIALADKNNKSSNTLSVKTKTVQTDTAYRFGFVSNDTSSTQIDFGTRIYDQRLGRYHHIDPSQQSPYTYDSLQRK